MKEVSGCCEATIYATLMDGVLTGHCSKCGKIIIKMKD